MNAATRNMLWLIACFIIGVTSYYLGAENGAKGVLAISRQDSVARALTRIDAALSAIQKDDPLYSKRVHQAELRAALSDLGTYSEALPHWQCSARDARITRAATQFFGSRAQGTAIGRTAAIERALRFCAGAATAKAD